MKRRRRRIEPVGGEPVAGRKAGSGGGEPGYEPGGKRWRGKPVREESAER